ncbi:MAG: beta propeller repeat protein, partial [Streptosporangiaceae bacterium]
MAATSPGNAWALGFTTATKTRETLIFHWNGRAWKRVANPGPAGASVYAVAATSARNAWMVGSTGSGKILILHWNGRAWKRVASPSPGHAFLNAVAATSARNAWAVGGDGSGKALVL